MLFTDLTTAELIKYAANAFLATKISFINMVADVCDALGADVGKVACGLGLDTRIGPRFLNAGLGFGGYCLPKDLRAFIRLAEENNVDCSLLRATENINRARVEKLIRKLRHALWVMHGKTVGILGLAFKAGTDDVREAPSLKVIEALLREGVRVQLYDPKAMENTSHVFPESPGRVAYCQNAYEAATGADALLVLTEWEEFRELDFERLRDLMQIPILVDGRNLLDQEIVRGCGFEYLCMGRSSSDLSSPDLAHPTPSPFAEIAA
jgi:UDPglucose 6-dehydrogenase